MHPSAPEIPRPPPGPRPYFAYAVLGACVLWFAVTEVAFEGARPLLLYGPLVREGQWWRVLSTVIEHGNLIHLLFNMSAVWTVGRAYERDIGTARFAEVSLVSALGSSAVVLWLGFDQPTVGASGMILGWLGAVLPIATKAHRRELLFWLAQIAVISALPALLGLPIISWQGHLGGFLAGLCCGAVLWARPAWFKYAAPVLAFTFAVMTVLAAR